MKILQQFIDEAEVDYPDVSSKSIMTAVYLAVLEATRQSNPDAPKMIAEARAFLDDREPFVVVCGGFAKGVTAVYGPYTKERALTILDEIGEEQGVVCEVLRPSDGFTRNDRYIHISFDGSGKVCASYHFMPSDSKGSSHTLANYEG